MLRNESSVPARSYAPKLRWRIFYWAFGLPMLVTGIAMAGLAILHDSSQHRGFSTLWEIGLWLALGVLGAVLVYEASRKAVLELTQTELRIYDTFRTKVVERAFITGFRVLNVQGIDVYELNHIRFSTQQKLKTRLSIVFKKDAVFDAWFDGIPNLDEVEIAASTKEVESDERLGSTREERVKAVTMARYVSIGLTGISYALFVWASIYPHPYKLMFLITAALPWLVLALCARWGGAFSIDDIGIKTVKGDLTRALVAPGFVLGLRAVSDSDLIHPINLIAPAMAGLAVMLFIVVWIAPTYRSRPGKTLLLAVLLAAYPAGAIGIANFLFDDSTATQHLVTVLEKRYSTGKSAAPYLLLSAWGPVKDDREVKVTDQLYRMTNVGELVCMEHHRGALGLDWYAVSAWRVCTTQYRVAPPKEKI